MSWLLFNVDRSGGQRRGGWWLAVALLVACAGCTETVEVLSSGAPVTPPAPPGFRWETCPDPLEKGQEGDACVETMGVCGGSTGDGCCIRRVYCVNGALVVQERCLEPCGGGCTVDAQCAMGSELCVGGLCQACKPLVDPCPPCPAGQVPRLRNGCRTCECEPSSACRSDAQCRVGERCYAGNACGVGCAPGDVSCCGGNFCAAAGCEPKAPTGCRLTGCGPGLRCEVVGCAPSTCTCAPDGRWSCTNDCVGGTCVP